MPSTNYAIEIHTRTVVDAPLRGLYDGVFALITGKFDTLGLTPSGDTERVDWARDKLKVFGNISKKIDVEEGGRYATLSGFSFELDNSDKLDTWMETNAIGLTRCKVNVYVVSGGIFNLNSTYEIDSVSVSLSSIKVQCIDIFKSFHRDAPPDTINTPLSDQNASGKPYPICLGWIKHAKLLNIEVNNSKAVLYKDLSTSKEFPACAATVNSIQSDGTQKLTLKTGSLSFGLNDLRDKWLVIVLGASREGIRIISSAVTSSSTTMVTLEKQFSKDITITVWTSGGDTYGKIPPTYFEIVQFYSVGVVSSNKIKEFVSSSTALLSNVDVHSYDSDLSKYVQIDSLVSEFNLENIKQYNRPGVKMLSSNLDIDGAYRTLFYIKPAKVMIGATDGYSNADNGNWDYVSHTFPAFGADAPNLYDRDQDTGYSLVGNFLGAYNISFKFDIDLPTMEIYDKFDDLILTFDVEVSRASTYIVSIEDFSLELIDMYGKVYTMAAEGQWNTGPIWESAPGVSGTTLIHSLPDGYYTGSPASNKLYSKFKKYFSLKRLMSDFKSLNIFHKMRLIVVMGFGSADVSAVPYTITFKELGFVGEKAINIKQTQLYTTVKGEVHNDTWGARRTATDEIIKIGDAIEYLMRAYDIGYNNPEYATIASESIGTASFDLVSATDRPNWYIGTQLESRDNSFEIINKMLDHAVCAIIPDKYGRRNISAWTDHATGGWGFDYVLNIDRDSVKEINEVHFSKIHNELYVQYDFNPGKGSYNKSILITKTNQDSFPLEATLIPGGSTTITFTHYWQVNEGTNSYFFFCDTAAFNIKAGDIISLTGGPGGASFTNETIEGPVVPLGFWITIVGFLSDADDHTEGIMTRQNTTEKLWHTYVSGIADYDLAEELWDELHAAYLITGKTNQYKKDLPFFFDESQWAGLSGIDSATRFVQKIIPWISSKKKKVKFLVDISMDEHTGLLAPCTFKHPIFTNNVAKQGHVISSTINTKTDKIEVEVLYKV